ncbi:MAG: hypothetical protein KF784_04655 [Fimbriimonadaceae bacterium]|nr:hypothetical protein [Fimbriimonadaceae bacterium]
MDLNPGQWNAKWIGPAAHPSEDLGVFAFRRTFTLETKTPDFWVRVSADNRYKLYVNGQMLAFGPQRGDEKHWFYETLDLAPYLVEGSNEIIALVWNFGRWAPMAQHTVRTAFVMESLRSPSPLTGEGWGGGEKGQSGGVASPPPSSLTLTASPLKGEEPGSRHPAYLQHAFISTPADWKVTRLDGWTFDMMHSGIGEFYIDNGPGEIIDTSLTPSPRLDEVAMGRGAGGWGTPASEEPEPKPGGFIPPYLTSSQPPPYFPPEIILNPWDTLEWRPPHVISQAEERGTLSGGTPWMLIPRSIPLMRYEVRAASPAARSAINDQRSDISQPTDQSKIQNPKSKIDLFPGQPLILDYGELLCAYPRIAARTLQKGQKATVKVTYAEAPWVVGKNEKGHRDELEGKEIRGYQDRFLFDHGGGVAEPLWWRTYRYIQIETDIPVQIEAIDAIETGYPLQEESRFTADDPWVEKIWRVSVRTAERCAGETYFDCPYYEQLQYVGDTRIQALIGYYLGRDRALTRNAVETLGWSIMENGLTQSRYPSRQPQVIPPFSLWWVMMVWDAVFYDPEFAHSIGEEARADLIRKIDRICEAFKSLPEAAPFWCFGDWVPGWRWGVPSGGLHAPMHQILLRLAQAARDWLQDGSFGDPTFPKMEQIADEHSEALRRVFQLFHGNAPYPWPAEALKAANAPECTYYFQYYKHLAMQPDDYMALMGPWKEMIENGLTTFAETPEPTRSDCHAWSAHPILGFFQLVAGVTSIAPGWKRARIAPKPGSLRRFDAQIAHPDGLLRVRYEDEKVLVETPVEAEFFWQGMKHVLIPGTHTIG